MLPLFVHRDDLHRNMARRRVEFQLVQTVQPRMSGRKMSSEMADRTILPRERDARRALCGDNSFKTLVSRQAQKNAGIVRIVLDDQHHRVVRSNVVAVVFDLRFTRDGQEGMHAPGRRSERLAHSGSIEPG